jgi:hypothetical protein
MYRARQADDLRAEEHLANVDAALAAERLPDLLLRRCDCGGLIDPKQPWIAHNCSVRRTA